MGHSNQICPSCGSGDWHDRDCPELKRKRRQFAPFILILIALVVLSSVGGDSVRPILGWDGGLIGALVGCAAFGVFIRWRRAKKARDLRRKAEGEPPYPLR